MAEVKPSDTTKEDLNQDLLFQRAPFMLRLLEKALPIIEAEADVRDGGMSLDVDDSYYTEMRDLANEISAEIDRARGRKTAPELDEVLADDYDYAADDHNFDAARERRFFNK
jgi:hypothetical protein